jgi:hypothetical protein
MKFSWFNVYWPSDIRGLWTLWQGNKLGEKKREGVQKKKKKKKVSQSAAIAVRWGWGKSRHLGDAQPWR